MSFEVRNEEIEARLKEIGTRIRASLEGTDHGFVLLIFSFGEGGNMFYTSNAQRQDVCNAMREFIAKHEPN
jgi:hypothetical protein